MKLSSSLYLIFSAGIASASKARPRSRADNGADFASREYDYVVIGGGTAGLAVAARLAEDPKVSVGVVEAGPYMPDDAFIEIPSNAFKMMGTPKYDWMFHSTPQKYLGDQTLGLPRGKVLGGCSAIDVLTFDRASKVEHDVWASFGGGKEWEWEGFMPYMKSAEKFVAADPFRVNYTGVDSDEIFPSQGTDGPLGVGFGRWYSDVVDPFWHALKKMHIPANYDPDSGNPFGTYNTPRAIDHKTGKRSYAANTYYANNVHLPNFVVLTEAQATKIEFEDSKSEKIRATGVSFVHNSEKFTVTAKKEVILSAGAFQSPQLLELSGIGNSTLLSQYGIETLVDLPGVGENFHDHFFTTVGYELKPGHVTMDNLRWNATLAAAAQEQYETTHDGMHTNSVAVVSFIDPSFITTPKELSDLTSKLDSEIERDGLTPLAEVQYKIQKDWLKQKLGHVEILLITSWFGGGTPKNDTSYMSVLMLGQHPFSRGNVHINSSDPLAPPQINPNFLSKSIDRDTLVQTTKFVFKMFEQEPMASLVVDRAYPPTNVTSDADITKWVESSTRGAHHHLGSVAMASRELHGVVDGELKVYGTSNLRVADASVIPIQMNFHPTRTAYGIGEKAAALIKKSN